MISVFKQACMNSQTRGVMGLYAKHVWHPVHPPIFSIQHQNVTAPAGGRGVGVRGVVAHSSIATSEHTQHDDKHTAACEHLFELEARAGACAHLRLSAVLTVLGGPHTNGPSPSGRMSETCELSLISPPYGGWWYSFSGSHGSRWVVSVPEECMPRVS